MKHKIFQNNYKIRLESKCKLKVLIIFFRYLILRSCKYFGKSVLKTFISYSHKDENARKRLQTHLAQLIRNKLIIPWFDRKILAGDVVDAEIASELESSELFLFLVSPDFIESNYCFEKEMTRAIERHKLGEVIIVPIIIEPCTWQDTPLKEFLALPKDGEPIALWKNENAAYLNVIEELQKVLSNKKPFKSVNNPEQKPSPEKEVLKTKYKAPKEFNEIEHGEFKTEAFSIISSYFEKEIVSISNTQGLKGLYKEYTSTSFGASILNLSVRSQQATHITVHLSSGNLGIGDLYYVFQENAPQGSSNGYFTIDDDGYEQYFNGLTNNFSRGINRLSAGEVANLIWLEFIKKAGVSHA